MASFSNLSVVGAEPRGGCPQSSEFADLFERWHAIEARLENLYKKHDDAISGTRLQGSNAQTLMSIQIEVEQVQSELLVEIASRPAKNVFDIIAKLEIWKSMVMPDGSDLSLAQPSDQIVHSVLSDLLAGLANID